MSKLLLISSLAAACSMALAAQQALDAPGVAVTLNGAAVLHRSGVGYPSDALQAGVQGTVSLQVKLDAEGEVTDAQVLSGPEELRKATLQSVLQWHFAKELGGTTRSVEVAFALPPKGLTMPAAPLLVGQTGTIRSIQVLGLSEQARRDLLSRLPLHEGDEWNGESARRAAAVVGEFDQHLMLRPTSTTQSASGTTEVALTISGQIQRIKVGGNVQSAMVLQKVPPVYPADAKAARVQGIVHLAAVIGMDGTMQELHVISGPAELIQSSMDAVKQWVYKPTLLNGNPVQVETTIDINYTLGN